MAVDGSQLPPVDNDSWGQHVGDGLRQYAAQRMAETPSPFVQTGPGGQGYVPSPAQPDASQLPAVDHSGAAEGFLAHVRDKLQSIGQGISQDLFGGGSSSNQPTPAPAPAPTPTAAPSALSGDDLRAYARQQAADNGLDPDLFERQIDAESGFNPNAQSPAGATGIAQFMPSTAKGLGIDPNNPQQALAGAAKLMAQYKAQYGGDMSKALAAYNAGPNGNFNNPETQAYVSKIMSGGDSADVHATAKAVGAGADPSALAWARQNLGRQDYINLCEKFVENAQGKSGQYATALAAWQQQQGRQQTDLSQLQPGDIVYYGAAKENSGDGHAAIYAGNGKVISATSSGVKETPMAGYFNAPVLGFIPGNGAAAPAAPGAQSGQGPLTAIGNAVGGAVNAVKSAPQSFLSYVADKLQGLQQTAEANAAAATGPNGEMTGGALGVGQGTAAQQAQPAHNLGDVASAAGTGARAAFNADIASQTAPGTGAPPLGKVLDLPGDVVTNVLASVAGVKGSPSLPPDTIAPGKMETPYEASDVSKVPVVGGALPSALNPLTYAPIPGEAEAKTAKAGIDLAQGLRGIPSMAGASELADTVRASDPGLAKIIDGFNGAPTQPGVRDRIQNVARELQRAFIDENAPINRIGPNSEAAASTYAGRAGSATQRLEDDLGPVYQALGATNGRNQDLVDGLNTYVGLQRYLEVAQKKGTLTGAVDANGRRVMRRNGPGDIRTTADAQDALNRLAAQLGPGNMTRIQDADALRQQAMDRLLQDKVDSGFITQQAADDLKATYPHYNPVSVLQAIDQHEAGPIAGNTLSQVGNTIKRLTEEGSPADQLPAMQSAALAITKGQTNIMRNEAVKTIAQEAGVPTERAVEIRTGPNITPSQGGPAIPKNYSSLPKNVRQGTPSPPPNPLASVMTGVRQDPAGKVSFWNNGKRYLADFSGMPDVERALKRMDQQHLSVVGQIAHIANAPLRAGATTLSLPFQLRNAFFDAVDAWVRNGLKPTDIIRGYVDAATHSPAYRDYIEHGGGMGGFVMREPNVAKILRRQVDPAKAAAQLEREVRSSGGIVIQTPADVIRTAKQLGVDLATLKPIRRVGEIIESGPRVAAFKQAIGQGASAQTAAMAGRRVTVDFSRTGHLMREINAIVPFSNAALQGSLNLARTARSNPKAFAVRMGALTTAITGAYLWNRQYPERYADIPEYVKAGSVVFVLPNGAEPNDNGVGFKKNPYIALPMRELGALPYLITKGLEKAEGRNPDFGTAAAQALQATNPIGGQSLGMPVLGAPGKEALQQAANYDYFRGRPIVSESLANLPPGAQSTPQTSPAITDLAGLINRSPLRGVIGEQSPVREQHFIEDVTGGMGKTVLQAIDTASGKAVNAPLTASGIYKDYGGQTEQTMYDQRDAKMNDIAGKYRDTLEAMAKNGANIGPPPTSIEGVPLMPPEQADYRGYELEFLARIMKAAPQLNARLAALPTNTPQQIQARADVLQELTSGAQDYAKAMVARQIGPIEIRRRVLAQQGAGARKLYPQKQYEPVPA